MVRKICPWEANVWGNYAKIKGFSLATAIVLEFFFCLFAFGETSIYTFSGIRLQKLGNTYVVPVGGDSVSTKCIKIQQKKFLNMAKVDLG